MTCKLQAVSYSNMQIESTFQAVTMVHTSSRRTSMKQDKGSKVKRYFSSCYSIRFSFYVFNCLSLKLEQSSNWFDDCWNAPRLTLISLLFCVVRWAFWTAVITSQEARSPVNYKPSYKRFNMFQDSVESLLNFKISVKMCPLSAYTQPNRQVTPLSGHHEVILAHPNKQCDQEQRMRRKRRRRRRRVCKKHPQMFHICTVSLSQCGDIWIHSVIYPVNVVNYYMKFDKGRKKLQKIAIF